MACVTSWFSAPAGDRPEGCFSDLPFLGGTVEISLAFAGSLSYLLFLYFQPVDASRKQEDLAPCTLWCVTSGAAC